ncbi:MAG: RidA family protein [Pseudomonadota bacterium]
MAKSVYHLNPGFEKKFAAACAVSSGGFLFVMGLTPGSNAENLNMSEQVKKTYENIKTVLDAHKINFGQVVQERVYATNIEEFFQAAEIRTGVYEGFSPPATTWVEVERLLDPAYKVEIEIVASLT